MRWEDETLAYWLVWKPLVGMPMVTAWWWTGGLVGMSPCQYLMHAVESYDRAREDFTARNPAHPLARRGRGMVEVNAGPTVTYMLPGPD